MNEPPGARWRVPISALTIAEYFRDEKKHDVLLPMDNVFRFVQAGGEISGLLGRAALARRLPADPGHRGRRLAGADRFGPGRGGLGDPGGLRAGRRLHRSGRDRVLPISTARWCFRAPWRPRACIRPSIPSRRPRSCWTRRWSAKTMSRWRPRTRQAIEHYRELQDVIALLGMEELGAEDRKIVERARRLQRFLSPALRCHRGLHRGSRPLGQRWPTRSPAARRSSTATATNGAKARSTWWAISTRRARKRTPRAPRTSSRPRRRPPRRRRERRPSPDHRHAGGDPRRRRRRRLGARRGRERRVRRAAGPRRPPDRSAPRRSCAGPARTN